MPQHLYIMLSRTGTGMGKIIRKFTRSEYNHVSLTLDPALQSFASFARYTVDVALAGGYVKESAARFLYSGQPVPIRLYRITVSPSRYQQLQQLFSLAGQNTGLTYNSLGALLSTWRLRFHIPGSYTCLEFAAAVLDQPFCSLQELQAYLEPHLIYQGDLHELVTDSGDRSEPYFARRGILWGTADTAVHFTRLAGRLLRICKCVDPIAALE